MTHTRDCDQYKQTHHQNMVGISESSLTPCLTENIHLLFHRRSHDDIDARIPKIEDTHTVNSCCHSVLTTHSQQLLSFRPRNTQSTAAVILSSPYTVNSCCHSVLTIHNQQLLSRLPHNTLTVKLTMNLSPVLSMATPSCWPSLSSPLLPLQIKLIQK